MSYQQEPNQIIWAVREDGQLAGLTYQREQQERVDQVLPERVEILPELNGCNLGEMKCKNSGFDMCVHNNWIYKECAPGTKCKQNGNSIICDHV